MANKMLLVVVAVLASARAHVVFLQAGASQVLGVPLPAHAGYAAPSSPVANSRPAGADSLVTKAFETHNLFVELQNVTARDYYNYGYEFYDWKTRLAQGHYESRYGDVAVGTFFRVSPEGLRTTVEYTIDTSRGFQASSRSAIQAKPTALGYAGSPTPPGAFAPRKTMLDDESNPHVQAAYWGHNQATMFLHLEAPFHVSWGYHLTDTHSGRSRGQYESYHGNTAEGQYKDGDVTVDYTANDKSFSYSTN